MTQRRVKRSHHAILWLQTLLGACNSCEILPERNSRRLHWLACNPWAPRIVTTLRLYKEAAVIRRKPLMKVAILAGGQGSRLLEETQTKSKAMVRIGSKPILWHIMKYYGQYGYHHFVIALGYQSDSIRNYFGGVAARRPTMLNGEQMVYFPRTEPDWTVELIDTGLDTMSGGRIKRLSPYLGAAPFMLTWCDGLS